MIVHVATGLLGFEDKIEVLRTIVAVIHSSGHSLARDWIEPYYLRTKKPKLEKLDWKFIYRDCLDSIEKADLIVVEASGYSTFGVGFQVALAIQKKKPILVLTRSIPDSGVMSEGIIESFYEFKEYRPEDLEKIVSNFIKHNTVSTKDLRFNFVIDRQIFNHLQRKSHQKGRTKAEIVRDLLVEDIKRES